MNHQVRYHPGPVSEPYTAPITFRGRLLSYDPKLEKFGISASELTTFHLRLRNFVRPMLREEEVYIAGFIFLFFLFFVAFSVPVIGHVLWVLGLLTCCKRHSKIEQRKREAVKSFLEDENFKKWGLVGLMWHTDEKVKKLFLDFTSFRTTQTP